MSNGPRTSRPDSNDDPETEHLLDYEDLAEAYLDALARIECLEEYANRMQSIIAGMKKVKP